MKVGFVNIFGKPNAGKSTLLNALMGEKLAIVSPKVQTTRHRIKAIATTDRYQIVFSDTPGIIDPKYRLQTKMMQVVEQSLQDTDLALLIVAITDDWQANDELFAGLKLKAPGLVVINKADLASEERRREALEFFGSKPYAKRSLCTSAAKGWGIPELMDQILDLLPEGAPYYEGDDLSDLPVKFFASELIREKIFELFDEEIPYQTAVVVQEFQEKTTLTKIRADIVVYRESQKAIILGEGGRMIKKLGSLARLELEKLLERKVFLELFVKVRDRWRDSDVHLSEYGY